MTHFVVHLQSMNAPRALAQAKDVSLRAYVNAQVWRDRAMRVVAREEGAALAEYAVALTIAVIAIAGVVALANAVLGRFNAVTGVLQGN